MQYVGGVNILKEMLLVSTLSEEGIRAYHHGDLRKALLDAASALLAEVGVAAISLREVARRAGVSHNAPYRHFADRDALLAALALQGFEVLVRRIEALPVADLGRPVGPHVDPVSDLNRPVGPHIDPVADLGR